MITYPTKKLDQASFLMCKTGINPTVEGSFEKGRYRATFYFNSDDNSDLEFYADEWFNPQGDRTVDAKDLLDNFTYLKDKMYAIRDRIKAGGTNTCFGL